MSLARLLTTTGSVGREANETHRYKMMAPLPKFAAMKRPISLTPIKTKNEEVNVMQTKSLFAEEGHSPEGGAVEAVVEQPIGVLSVGVFEQQAAAEEPVQTEVKPMKAESWFSKILNIFRRKKAEEVAPAPVQTEWSLDKVKVVRNDLSDVDLDIVFASVEATSAKKAPAKKEKLVSSAWRRVNPNPQKQEEMVLK